MAKELEKDEFVVVKKFFNANLYQIPALAVLNMDFPDYANDIWHLAASKWFL